MRKYETVLIVRTDISDAAMDKVHERIAGLVAKMGGVEIKFEVWGKRKLSYEIKKNLKGIYVYFLFLGGSEVVKELERNLKLMDSILKFLTVKLEDEVAEADFEIALAQAKSDDRRHHIDDMENDDDDDDDDDDKKDGDDDKKDK